jgi:hypothetical protein
MRQEFAVPSSGNGPLRPESIPAELVALAECLWSNQSTLITKAAEHFGIRPSLAATLMLPVLFQAIAGAHPDKRSMRRLVNETIDKGFDDWLRTAHVVGGAQ